MWCWLWLSWIANAGTLAGVTLPDHATVGGAELVLNGLGLREKYFFDIYVGGLYLPAPTRDAKSAIESDVPKRIVMHFIYEQGVTATQINETFTEGFSKTSGASALSAELAQLESWMEDMKPGDQVILDYVPGKGTTVLVKGKSKGTVVGLPFMTALWSVYLGSSPPTPALKAGMLGGR